MCPSTFIHQKHTVMTYIITDLSQDLYINGTDVVKPEYISKSSIASIVIDKNRLNVGDVIILQRSTEKSRNQNSDFEIYVNKVTSPSFTSTEQLANIIRLYKDSVGKVQSFEATEGQTQFTVTDFDLTDNLFVFVDGVYITSSAYSRSGNVVTFSSPLVGGEEVDIRI